MGTELGDRSIAVLLEERDSRRPTTVFDESAEQGVRSSDSNIAGSMVICNGRGGSSRIESMSLSPPPSGSGFSRICCNNGADDIRRIESLFLTPSSSESDFSLGEGAGVQAIDSSISIP